MSFKYKNSSKFYKRLVVNGRRINIPPDGIFSSDKEFDLEIHDFLTKAGDTDEPTVQYNDDKKKIEVVDQSKYEKLEQAVLVLHKKIPTTEDIKKSIQEVLDSTPKVEQEELETLAKQLKELKTTLTENPNAQLAQKLTEIEEYVKTTLDRRQHVLKDAIDEVNAAVVNLEKYVYEGDWDNLPIVLAEDDEPINGEEAKDTGPSIEDILKGN
jgi:hypothetical protein